VSGLPFDNDRRAAYGGAAVVAGTPDFGKNGHDLDGARTDAVDAIANILHHLADTFGHRTLESGALVGADEQAVLDVQEEFALSALDSARIHFRAELRHLDD
jgi:hypothetical protein